MAHDIDSSLEHALQLTHQGKPEDAKRVYLEILAKAPANFAALNNLGALLHDMGYRSAARTAYAQAVACHPENPMGHVNLANALRDAGELNEARSHCETALRLSPKHLGAHQALGDVLSDLGEDVLAAKHRRLGFTDQPAIVLPYRGTGKAKSLLLLVSAVGGNVPIRHLIDDTIFQVTVVYADYWTAPLPRHDFIFNTIGDADLCRDALLNARNLIACSTAPVLNPPTAILPTGRAESAIRLANLTGVRAAKTITLPRNKVIGPGVAALLARHGLTFPLLLRSPGYHTGQHFERAETVEQFVDIAAKLPGRDVMAIEYLNAEGKDGKARKYRALFVNGEILPLHLCVSNDWKVHYYTSAMAGSAAYRAEEERFLNDMPGTIGPRAMKALTAIRDTLGLDYGGIDFGLNADGELLLFEANATMIIVAPGADGCWDYRRAAIAKVEHAVRAMLLGTPTKRHKAA